MTFGNTGVQVTGRDSVPRLVTCLEVLVFFKCMMPPCRPGHSREALDHARGMEHRRLFCDPDRVPLWAPLPGIVSLGRAGVLRGAGRCCGAQAGASSFKIPFKPRTCAAGGQLTSLFTTHI